MGSNVQDKTYEAIEQLERNTKPFIKFVNDSRSQVHAKRSTQGEPSFEFYLKYLFGCCLRPKDIMLMLGFRVTVGSPSIAI